jgi:septal ring factor EnvC (AmiA/AmiB activator)
LSVCPKCGAKVANAVKTWSASLAKTKNLEGKPQIFIGILECPNCKTKFRARVRPAQKLEQTANVKNEVERIKDVREELMQTLKSLREKIQMLETERKTLLDEVESLRKAAESRVTSLEGEVNQMREEAKALKELLGANDNVPVQPLPAESGSNTS